MSERDLGFNDRQRSAAGSLGSGGVTLLTGTASRYQFIDFLDITNNSTSSGVTLSLYIGGVFQWSISCAALFTKTFNFPAPFGWMRPAASTAENIRLTLGAGSAVVRYMFIGHESRDAA